MAVLLSKWERRDGADREQLAVAAYNLCRASRAHGTKVCRFFWAGPDTVVILAEADTAHVFDDPAKPDLALAQFALADLARNVDTERWIDPRDGEAAYRSAGR